MNQQTAYSSLTDLDEDQFPALTEDDVLVEEVSIDGMCGVY